MPSGLKVTTPSNIIPNTTGQKLLIASISDKLNEILSIAKTPIIGPRTINQLRDNVGSIHVKLTSPEIQQIDQVSKNN